MKKNKVSIRPYTRQFYKGNGLCFALGIADNILSVVINLLISLVLQLVMDLLAGEDIGLNLWQITVIALAAVGIGLISYLCLYFSRPKFVSRGIAQYKNYVFERLTQKGIAAFSKEDTGLYLSALSNDAATIETGYLDSIFGLIFQSLMFVATLVMMFWYSPLLTMIAIGLSLLPIAVSLLTGDKLASAEKRLSDENEGYVSTLKDSLSGFSVMKIFRAEKKIAGVFAATVERVANARTKRGKLMVIIEMMGMLSRVTVQFGIFLIGSALALSGKNITAGTLLLFVQLLNFVLGPIEMIPQYLAQRKAAKALIAKIAEALESNVRDGGENVPAVLESGITLDGITFGYDPDAPVLHDVSAVFEAGKSYAIVGASGSGKSTLLSLLTGSHDSYDGTIRYDGHEVRDISSESLYDIISLVQQSVFVFNDTVRSNITMYGDFAAEDVESAIHLSGLDAFIEKNGEEYLCGENGNKLSGGERQRIAIARSLLRKNPVLLVDEATAALDRETSYHVFDSILKLQELTRIVVTHDLEEALLRRYDRILVMKQGRIVEQGEFEALMEEKGYFYALYMTAQ